MATAPSNRSNSGFTAPEIVVVLAIVGMAALAAVPPFLTLLRSCQAEAAVNELAISMRAARSKAISQSNPFVWIYEPSSGKYGSFDDDNGNGSLDAGENVYGPFDLPSTLTLLTSDLPVTGVSFGPLGNASVGGSLQFSDNKGAVVWLRLEAATGMAHVSEHEEEEPS